MSKTQIQITEDVHSALYVIKTLKERNSFSDAIVDLVEDAGYEMPEEGEDKRDLLLRMGREMER
jgi:predicted CopG family antitoxin